MQKLRNGFQMVAALCCLGFASACSSVAHLKTDDEKETRATASSNHQNIKVYSLKDIGRPYRVLGLVVASADAGDESFSVVEKLKKEAAEVGANAIVGLRLEIDYGYWQGAVKATGLAAKY